MLSNCLHNHICYIWAVLMLASQHVLADSHKGDSPKPDFSIEEQNSVLYIYREKMVTASTVPYHCYLNDEFITVLNNGQYHRYVATPGQYDYWVEMISVDSNRIVSRSYQEIELQAGKIYFIKNLPDIRNKGVSWEIVIQMPENSKAEEEIMKLWHK